MNNFEEEDALEIDTTNSTTHHTISKAAQRYFQTEDSNSLIATGHFQPLPPEKVRLLYRYTFASVECVGTGLSTFRFSDVPGLKRLGRGDEEDHEDEEMDEEGTPKKKKTKRKKKQHEDSEEESRDSEEEYYQRYETVESMGELMHCVDLVGRFQRHKYCNMIEDPFVRLGLSEMTWEEWSKLERVWNFRNGLNPEPEMIQVANAYTVGELTKEQLAQETSRKRRLLTHDERISHDQQR